MKTEKDGGGGKLSLSLLWADMPDEYDFKQALSSGIYEDIPDMVRDFRTAQNI